MSKLAQANLALGSTSYKILFDGDYYAVYENSNSAYRVVDKLSYYFSLEALISEASLQSVFSI